MSFERDVLERNLELLFTRAWRPAAARPAFRVQLARTFMERAATRVQPARAPRRLAWVAAAALLVAALGWFVARPTGSAQQRNPASILASGEVAWRAGAGPWNALAPRPQASGGALADLGARSAPLEVRTPAGAAARVELATGALRVAAGARAELLGARELLLTAGALDFEARQAPSMPGAQTLRTAAGEVELSAGRAHLDLALDGLELAVQLVGASARVSDVPTARSLEGDHRLRLRAGRIVEPELPERTARSLPTVEPEVAEELREAGEPQAPAVLRGVVRQPDGFDQAGVARWRAVESFRVLLLREVQLPMATMPEVQDVHDAEGRFTLPPCEPGSFSLFVQVSGHAVWRAGELELGDAPLDPAAVPVLDVRVELGLSVSGVVRDALSGEPLMDAVVVSESDAPVRVLALDAQTLEAMGLVRFTRSGPDGGYELEHVAAGTQILRASDAGHSVAWAEPLELQGTAPLTGVDFALPRAGALEGRVLDALGQPRSGASVLVSATNFAMQRPCLSYKATRVDAEGHYAVDGLPGGQLAVLLFAGGLAGEQGTPDLRFANVRPPATAHLDFIDKPAGSRLVGVLRDSAGVPQSGRSLWLDRGSAEDGAPSMVSTTTAADGGFEFEGLLPGSYELFLSGRLPPDLCFVERVLVTAGGTTRVELTLAAESISGRVYAQTQGTPVSAAVVVLQRAGDGHFVGKSLTDAEGRFSAVHVAPGLYDLRVVPLRGQLGDVALSGVAVAAGAGVSGLEVILPRGGSLDVLVSDALGRPLQNARVELLEPGGEACYQEEPALCGSDGRRFFEGLRVGDWTLRVRLAGHAPVELAVQVRAGELSSVRATLEPQR